mgnify:FL=1
MKITIQDNYIIDVNIDPPFFVILHKITKNGGSEYLKHRMISHI